MKLHRAFPRLLTIAIALGWTCLAGVALAADFTVGRAKVTLPGQDWRAIPVADAGEDYSGDVSGNIKSQTVAFLKETLGKPLLALVVVRGNAGGITRGAMSYSPSCKSGEHWVATGNAGFNRSFAECWQVARQAHSAADIFRALAPKAAEALAGDKALLPQSFQPVLSSYANSNGTFLDVRVFLGPGFVGTAALSVAPPANRTVEVLVDWGKDLAAAVRGSVNSMSGELVFPAFSFVDLPPAPPVIRIPQGS